MPHFEIFGHLRCILVQEHASLRLSLASVSAHALFSQYFYHVIGIHVGSQLIRGHVWGWMVCACLEVVPAPKCLGDFHVLTRLTLEPGAVTFTQNGDVLWRKNIKSFTRLIYICYDIIYIYIFLY